jgi:hypothetical protein
MDRKIHLSVYTNTGKTFLTLILGAYFKTADEFSADFICVSYSIFATSNIIVVEKHNIVFFLKH